MMALDSSGVRPKSSRLATSALACASSWVSPQYQGVVPSAGDSKGQWPRCPSTTRLGQ